MTVTGVDTLAVVVADARKAIAWYQDALGLRVAYIGPSTPNVDPTVRGAADNPGHRIELGPGRPGRGSVSASSGERRSWGPRGSRS